MGERVAVRTRGRGPSDPSRRPLVWFILGSLLLHVPFTPLAALIGLLALLRAHPKEAPEEHLNAIPISLLSPEEMAALGASPAEPPPKAEEAPAPEPSEP